MAKRLARTAAVSVAGLAVVVMTLLSVSIVGAPFVSAVQLLVTVALLVVTAQYVRLTGSLARSATDQLNASERALRVTNERASKERSLEYCLFFVDKFMPAYRTFREELQVAKLPIRYEGPVGDFTPSSLSVDAATSGAPRAALRSGIEARNVLEVFAAAFMYGVADADIAFALNGSAYCSYVALMYDCIALTRSPGNPQTWQPVVDLYDLWKYKLSAGELAEAREKLEEELVKAKTAQQAAPKVIGV